MSENKFTTDVVIGLEIHVELNTQSKLFCSCPTKGSEEPNNRTCPICLGHPGSKPVLNKKALEYALKLGLALNCNIDKELVFSRKSYFYPDMSKNYQITQYEQPLCTHGYLKLKSGKKIRIRRIHVEEDPAALVHPSSIHSSEYVLVDYNRSGNPLCEVVTEPDLASPEEAREFMNKLITILEYLDIFDVNHGIIKADGNVSIKESGYVRSEVKNITGFKEIERALVYETQRQQRAFHNNEQFITDTRSWDSALGITNRLRTKETEEDYGYIIDTDLVITDVTEEMVQKIRVDMPELADDKMEKFLKEHNIAQDMAEIISKDKDLAAIYEEVVKHVNADLASKWVRRELQRVLNYNKKKMSEVALTPKHFIDLLKLIESGKITEKVGQKILNDLVLNPFDVNEYVKKEGLEQVKDSSEIEGICKEALAENAKALEQVKSGDEKALNFLIGQVMRKSKGKANPQVAKETLMKLIK
jgi:aspartyl-tRNA(Asn)/glutamyl-tRNA(Gln) amidotransferase subunit B